jgi:hypothetical protein
VSWGYKIPSMSEYDRKNSRKNWWIVDDSTYELAQFSTVNGWFRDWFLLLRFFLWVELPDLVSWRCGVFIKCQLYEYSFGECPNYLDGNILKWSFRLLRSGADAVFLSVFFFFQIIIINKAKKPNYVNDSLA